MMKKGVNQNYIYYRKVINVLIIKESNLAETFINFKNIQRNIINGFRRFNA